MAVLFWIFLDHICLKWIKHDQTCSIGFLTNQKTFLYKIVAFKIRIKIAILFWIRLDQICPKWIKLDKIGLIWIKLDQIRSNWI